MMRRSQREFNPSAIEQAAQRNWNEAWGYHRDNARRWFYVSMCAVGVAGVAVAHSWYHDTKPERVPWLVDRNGPSVMVAQLVKQMPDATRIMGHLTTWVMGMRTVTSDPLFQKHLVDQTENWVDASTIAYQQLNDWYRVNNPFERVKTNTVDVDVTAVVPQGGNSWLIDWSETAYAHDPGKTPTVSYWRMSATVNIHLPETDDEFRANWDGVYTTSLHIIPLPGRPGA